MSEEKFSRGCRPISVGKLEPRQSRTRPQICNVTTCVFLCFFIKIYMMHLIKTPHDCNVNGNGVPLRKMDDILQKLSQFLKRHS